MKPIRYGSVCSGIEAATMAWHDMGWEAAWFSEVDKQPKAVLADLWPDVIDHGDMLSIPEAIARGEIEAPDVLAGGTPCFTAGHMVLTDAGYRPIEGVRAGDMVVTHEGRLRRVVRAGAKRADVGRLSGVGLPSGITCTAGHPFRSVSYRMQNTRREGVYARVEHCGTPEWTPAKDMPGLNWCALSSHEGEAVSIPGGMTDSDAMYLAGFYLGDGFIRTWKDSDNKAVVFGINDTKLAKLKENVSAAFWTGRERTGPRIVLSNKIFAGWLADNFGQRSEGKTLPAWVMSHPLRDRLLAGYLDTDGCMTGNGWNSVSVSRSLAYGICDLAITCGFVASVSFTATPDTTVIEGRTVSQRDYWAVRAFPISESRKARVRHGMLLRKVSGYQPLGSDTVYNIEVEGDHSYILDGAIVHNCQSFSVAGARAGLEDERGQLTIKFVETANAIDDQRRMDNEQPCIVVWENVPGVLSHKDNPFGAFLGLLCGESIALEPPGGRWKNAGYVHGPERAVAWRVLDAQYFGVAQRRRRVFVVASARKGFDPRAVLFESEGVRRDTPPRREPGQGFTHDVAPSLVSSGRGVERIGETRGQDPVVSCYGGGRCGSALDVAACITGRGQRIDFEVETFAVHGTQDPCVSKEFAFSLGRNNGGENAIYSGLRVRRLTPVEAERLQGFPDNHTAILYRGKPMADGPRYKMIGNSMAVPVMAWIGKRINDALSDKH